MNSTRKSGIVIERAYRKAPLHGLLFILSFLIVASIVVSARARLASRAQAVEPVPERSVTATPASVAAQSKSPQQRVETELVTITTNGFEPSEITRPQGRFFLEVDNRSQLREVNLRLDSEHGERVHQKRVPREQLDWYQSLELHPGRYVLTEANHPEWRFQLTITAR